MRNYSPIYGKILDIGRWRGILPVVLEPGTYRFELEVVSKVDAYMEVPDYD